MSERYRCPIIAVDPSETMLLEGQRDQNPEIKINRLNGVAEDIPIGDNSVDLVWMSQTFHHIDKTDLAFKEISRVLKKSGYFAVRNGMKDHIDVIRTVGEVSHEGMLRTFNLGVGLVVVCRKPNVDSIIESLRSDGEEAYWIGEIVKGSGQVQCTGQIKYDIEQTG